MSSKTFENWLLKYRNSNNGSLDSLPPDRCRDRFGKYTDEVENELVKYIKLLRNQWYKKDNCGLNWLYLKHKAGEIADRLLIPEEKAEFHISDGWLEKVLARHSLIGVNLHGEANYVDEVQAKQNMDI